MNIHEMTIEQLQSIKISSVEQGRKLADEILKAQLDIHHLMVDEHDNAKWRELCDRHYDLRKVRHRILIEAGNLVALKKNLKRR